ncbi:L-alanine-DL-glutamate epimerase-like enolase superfamily enzyme [Flavobacterium chryseum]|uniref:dipeptide epimerase n=1 Tax=Flavobacterium sp. P3160 TaxID=2512113 RepID=UPI001061FA48|nr:dipeptide epimerase [Flavobacterium sp. P3160]TDO70455.1 L-alanine-DL-glutamate epimerase-like enolase superfamily enzyme [Flavobacterium sp. P3160]
MKLILRAYDLKLKHTFRISRKSIDFQPSLIVELQEDGFSGFGEATSNPYYNITIEILQNDIEQIREVIEKTTNESPDEFWNKISPLLANNPFALCALDNAYNDLYARKKGKKLYELWNYDISHNPLTNYTIGIGTIENMIAKMKELPWPIYKIKLGTPDDIAIVTELRKHSNAIFRVDANCAWTVDEMLSNALILKDLGVEFIEQPLKANDWEGQKQVFKNSVLPIMADESCIEEADVAKCYNHFHGVNIKLMKCGGITPGKRMIAEAKKLGLKTMVGCMTESTVGISAIAHLLPELDYVDMDGALLLAEDIASGVTIKNGKTFYPDRTGTGVILF